MKTLITTLIILSILMGLDKVTAQINEPGSGNALKFDGINNRVDLSSVNNVGIENNQPFSVECWFMSNDTGSTGTFVSRFYGGPSSGLFSWAFMYSNGNVTFSLNNSQILGNTAVASNITDGRWYHAVATYDGSTGWLYINGVLADSVVNPGGTTNPISTISCGKMSYSYANDGHPFNGEIDEIRIWNRTLTQAEIQRNMCRKLPDCADPSLVGYWRMDEGTDNTCIGGKDVCDASCNGNHGTKF